MINCKIGPWEKCQLLKFVLIKDSKKIKTMNGIQKKILSDLFIVLKGIEVKMAVKYYNKVTRLQKLALLTLLILFTAELTVH